MKMKRKYHWILLKGLIPTAVEVFINTTFILISARFLLVVYVVQFLLLYVAIGTFCSCFYGVRELVSVRFVRLPCDLLLLQEGRTRFYE